MIWKYKFLIKVVLLFLLIDYLECLTSPFIKSLSVIKPNSILLKLSQEIQESRAINFINELKQMDMAVPNFISDDKISATYVKCDMKVSNAVADSIFEFVKTKDDRIPLVMIHGFDSSCLEFRRLGPILSELVGPIYIPDVLGWGFTNMSKVKAFDPEAKIEYLKCFIEQIVQKPCVLVGASLGGGISILLASKYPNLIKNVVLIDPQALIDGTGEKSNIPDSIAKFALGILKSKPLRMYANIISYTSKEFSTWDAMRVGRLHCFNEDWERASLHFLKSGGFIFSDKISSVYQKTLIIWGKDDKIIDSSNGIKLKEALPNAQLEYVENCGHVPHLEKPVETSQLIHRFLSSV